MGRRSRREGDPNTRKALTPPELFARERRCADGHLNEGVGKHDVNACGVGKSGEDSPGDAEGREAVMILFGGLGQREGHATDLSERSHAWVLTIPRRTGRGLTSGISGERSESAACRG